MRIEKLLVATATLCLLVACSQGNAPQEQSAKISVRVTGMVQSLGIT